MVGFCVLVVEELSELGLGLEGNCTGLMLVLFLQVIWQLKPCKRPLMNPCLSCRFDLCTWETKDNVSGPFILILTLSLPQYLVS